jgi:hypothetical protein
MTAVRQELASSAQTTPPPKVMDAITEANRSVHLADPPRAGRQSEINEPLLLSCATRVDTISTKKHTAATRASLGPNAAEHTLKMDTSSLLSEPISSLVIIVASTKAKADDNR